MTQMEAQKRRPLEAIRIPTAVIRISAERAQFPRDGALSRKLIHNPRRMEFPRNARGWQQSFGALPERSKTTTPTLAGAAKNCADDAARLVLHVAGAHHPHRRSARFLILRRTAAPPDRPQCAVLEGRWRPPTPLNGSDYQ